MSGLSLSPMRRWSWAAPRLRGAGARRLSIRNLALQGKRSAILAQSVGGGGGAGGFSSAVALTGNITPTVAVGGSGGTGGSGDDVSVTNTGIIGTQRENSQGILAQSVGGGGGTGGSSISASVGVVSVAVSVGGSGGTGGSGGDVSVDNASAITTQGDASQAILAQSVGGGGGAGGFSVAGAVAIGG